MVDKNVSLGNSIDEILLIYQNILQNPSFKMYEENANRLDQLYEDVKNQPITSEDKVKIAQILELNEQVIQVILNEKVMLSQEIIMFEKKKQATNYYGKLSNTYDVGAFFVDFKSK
ncbi:MULTISPECIES: hypothetical protein [Paenibacillus]|uniref:Uncharacterized protein n=1 Tax=Paenibacillus albilobatus TaxID=2716884 RepID=A0A919XM30_9BACL|nr:MULTISPECIES: hypothetical protein [Paenibacillus]GIO33300.1 hypothetical protein J2TS6_44410 [Paenibacillus albilobatus]